MWALRRHAPINITSNVEQPSYMLDGREGVLLGAEDGARARRSCLGAKRGGSAMATVAARSPCMAAMLHWCSGGAGDGWDPRGRLCRVRTAAPAHVVWSAPSRSCSALSCTAV